MTEKKNISDEELALFHQAMKQVKPLRPEIKTHLASKKHLSHSIRPTKPTSPITTMTTATVNIREKDDWVSGEEVIYFRRSGLQQRYWQSFKRGQMTIDATLDLHRLTANEAIQAVEHLLQQAAHKKWRCICLIHGKGNYSLTTKPILKNVLNDYLRNLPSVLAFHSATRKHGGTGAVYVLLRGNIKNINYQE